MFVLLSFVMYICKSRGHYKLNMLSYTIFVLSNESKLKFFGGRFTNVYRLPTCDTNLKPDAISLSAVGLSVVLINCFIGVYLLSHFVVYYFLFFSLSLVSAPASDKSLSFFVGAPPVSDSPPCV